MAEEIQNVHLSIQGQDQLVSLLDLAGVDITDIPEFRGGEQAPEGVYEWRVKLAELTSMDVKNGDDPTGPKIPRPVISFHLESLACRNVKDPSIDPTSLTGISHTERIFLKDLMKDLGRAKAFMTDIGLAATGSVRDLLEQCTGMEFVAAIKHTTDRNDKDRKYANIDNKTITPMMEVAQPATVASVGGAVAGVAAAAPAAMQQVAGLAGIRR